MSDPIERPQLPVSDLHLLSCRDCGLILTREQWKREGCHTCGKEPMNEEEVKEYTTAKFSGYVGIINGEGSWVARLLSKVDKPPGVYAAQVEADDDEEEEAGGDDDDGFGADDGRVDADYDDELLGI